MKWRKELVITGLLLTLPQSASTCTSVQWWPGDVVVRVFIPSYSCLFSCARGEEWPQGDSNPLGQKEQLQRRKVLFFGFGLTFSAWMSRVDSWLTLCPVLLSLKWGNNAYLIRMLQELCKTFGKCFRNWKHWHSARGSNFLCFWVVVVFFCF